MPDTKLRSDSSRQERDGSAVDKKALDTIADLFQELYAPAIKTLERT